MGEKAQTWARAQLRGCALGVLGFLLFFFIIGVVASNDFESDPYSPVSAGGLAKVVLIPICIILGVAFVKVALPMFGGGKRAAASKKYQDLARQRISDNRYRSGNAIAISNALIVIGVIVVTASFAREDPQQGVLGAIICVAALRYAGRLRSERAAAQHLGARTLTDDVKDSVSNFAAASAAVSVGIASLTAEGARKIAARFKAALQNDAQLGVEGLKMDNDDQKVILNFLEAIRDLFGPHVQAIRSQGAKSQASPRSRPVASGRQAILDSYVLSSNGNALAARSMMSKAIELCDSGSVHPDATEWMIDGPEIGRGHACMWGAIARTFAHKQPQSFAGVDALLSDSWFGAAVLIFMETDERQMAGRAAQEWAESRRLAGDQRGADVLNNLAAFFFIASDNQPRAAAAFGRIGERSAVSVDSTFLLGRPATESEAALLTTVLGARNSQRLFDSLG